MFFYVHIFNGFSVMNEMTLHYFVLCSDCWHDFR